MSLFVGNISRNARGEDIEKEFQKIGSCRIKLKGSYAFIVYDEERNAEEAIRSIQNKSIGGRELNIEWSKNSGRFESSNSKRMKTSSRSPRRRNIEDERCYKCGHHGHFAYDCRDRDTRKKRHRHRSRSRSRSKKHKKRSDTKDRHRNRSRSSNSSDRKKNHRKKTVSSQSRSNSDKSLSNRIKDDKSPKKESKSKEITFKEENNVTTINPNNLNLKENILVDTPEESKSIEISKDDKIDNNLNCIDEISKNEIGEIVQINNDNKNDKVNLKENIIENNNGDNNGLYNKMKVDELKSELKKRNLTFTKNDRKNDLINLLKQNDSESSSKPK